MSRDAFLDCTLRELFREFVKAKRRWERERQRDIHLAWQCVKIFIMSQRPTANGTAWRLPDFKTVLALPVKRQSPDDMVNTLRFLSKKTGFPLKEIHA